MYFPIILANVSCCKINLIIVTNSFFFLRIALLIRLDICKTGHNIHEDVDALQKDLLIEELVVVMEQDWRVIHWREPDSRDANLAQIAHIRASRAHNWTDLTSNSHRRYLNLKVFPGCF